MLQLKIEEGEMFDEERNEFVHVPSIELRLEHSLLSIAKWESIWKKPFLTKDPKTHEQLLDYIRCMTLNQHVDPGVYYGLTSKDIEKVTEYIETDQTATWFSDSKSGPPSRDIVTSELIYYQMTAHNIPFECQKWHLSRLLTLIRICAIKNNPEQKKMTKSQIYAQNRKLNAARRKARGSKG